MIYGYREAQDIVLEEFVVQQKTQKLNIPTLMGPPGIGKSALAFDVAVLKEISYRPINVGDSSDPTDITGTPVPEGILPNVASSLSGNALRDWEKAMKSQGLSQTGAEGRVERIIWAVNNVAYESIVSPTLQLFDDFDKAPDSVQKGLIGLFGTRMYRDYKLHPLSLLMCAGNRVGDDLLAGDISQSILGRITVIEMEAKFEDFTEYARLNPGEIHQEIIGFLQAPSNRELLYQPIEDGAYRAPTPRGWWEASQHFFELPTPKNKDEAKKLNARMASIIDRKCGTPTKNQWNAWWTVLSKVNVEEILTTGKIIRPPSEGEVMFQYACIFAVARHMAHNKVQQNWRGLHPFAESLRKEFRVAFLVQLSKKVQLELAQHYGPTINLLMEGLVDAAPGT